MNRPKMNPSELRDALALNLKIRQVADYGRDQVTQTQAGRALRRTRAFVEPVQGGGVKR